MSFWLLWFAGCDTNGGVIEESKELVEAIEDGKSLKKVGKQAQDVVDAITARRNELDKRVSKAERWVKKQRRQAGLGNKQLSKKLDQLEEELKQARDALSQAGELGAELDRSVEQIEGEIDELIEQLGSD